MRKIYYKPGMLSLIFLPILFLVLVPNKKPETVLRFSLVSDRPTTPGITTHNTSFVLEKTKGKHLIAIDLDSNTALNGRKMLYIEQEAMRINYSYDTTSVIRVSLSDSTTYGTFVQLLNIMTADVIKRYALIGNDFYIFGDVPIVKTTNNIQTFSCGLMPTPTLKPGFHETIKLNIKDGIHVIQKNTVLLLSFFLLIITPLLFRIFRHD